MRLICGPAGFGGQIKDSAALRVTLYSQPEKPGYASTGGAALAHIRRQKLAPNARGWDFLTIALSVVAADFAVSRDGSPDGWTREIVLDVALKDPDFWSSQADALQVALGFLTTDRWTLRFHAGGFVPPPPPRTYRPLNDSVMLLSGGLDSLIGGIDLAAAGLKPFAVSQTVRGDGAKQVDFAAKIGGGLRHIQLNHNVQVPHGMEDSQRGRSMVFIAFAVAVATALARHRAGTEVPLYVCENGFIAMNAPLTGIRLGSLSTRTAHPEYLGRLQAILDAAGIKVRLINPYATKTKGEMLSDCADQGFLLSEAARSTSCGRFQRFGYKHCGRCVPCQVRRAAFMRWGQTDTTTYVYTKLGRDDPEYSQFDDVRAVAMALAAITTDGFERWLGPALSSSYLDRPATKAMLERGMAEFRTLHGAYGVT